MTPPNPDSLRAATRALKDAVTPFEAARPENVFGGQVGHLGPSIEYVARAVLDAAFAAARTTDRRALTALIATAISDISVTDLYGDELVSVAHTVVEALTPLLAERDALAAEVARLHEEIEAWRTGRRSPVTRPAPEVPDALRLAGALVRNACAMDGPPTDEPAIADPAALAELLRDASAALQALDAVVRRQNLELDTRARGEL